MTTELRGWGHSGVGYRDSHYHAEGDQPVIGIEGEHFVAGKDHAAAAIVVCIMIDREFLAGDALCLVY